MPGLIGGGMPGLIGGGGMPPICGCPPLLLLLYCIAGPLNCGRNADGAGPPTPLAGPLNPGTAPIIGIPRPAATPIPGPPDVTGTFAAVRPAPFRGRSSCGGRPSTVIDTT